MLGTKDCNYEEQITQQSNLRLALGRLLRKVWTILAALIKHVSEASYMGRIQL